MAAANPYTSAGYGNSEGAYLGAPDSAARFQVIGGTFPGSNLPNPIPLGRYGAFNIGGALGLDVFPVRFGKLRGMIARDPIVRSNTGSSTGNTYPYGNHST